jgi:hypothetical protein
MRAEMTLVKKKLMASGLGATVKRGPDDMEEPDVLTRQ